MGELYGPNSHKSKAENEANTEKRVEKAVVTSGVKVKKNNVRKFTDAFISGDTQNLKEYIIMDVVIPTVKKALVEAITTAADMIFYGGKGAGKRSTNTGYVSYDRFSSRRDESDAPPRAYKSYSYENVTIDSRGEAEMVLREMRNLINRYGMARVMDFYDLVGVTGDYTDMSYGWTDLRDAEVVRRYNGYTINLPKAYPIKRD